MDSHGRRDVRVCPRESEKRDNRNLTILYFTVRRKKERKRKEGKKEGKKEGRKKGKQARKASKKERKEIPQ